MDLNVLISSSLDVISDLYHYVNPKTNQKSPMISDEVYEIVQRNSEVMLPCILKFVACQFLNISLADLSQFLP